MGGEGIEWLDLMAKSAWVSLIKSPPFLHSFEGTTRVINNQPDDRWSDAGRFSVEIDNQEFSSVRNASSRPFSGVMGRAKFGI